LNLPGGRYNFKWINTLNGIIVKSGKLTVKSSPVILESPDYNDDIALKIVRK
jgi:hypothetical protein